MLYLRVTVPGCLHRRDRPFQIVQGFALCRKKGLRRRNFPGFKSSRDEPNHLRLKIQAVSAFRSPSGTLLGGIGIGPHTPPPPVLIFCASLSAADWSPAYFLATSLKPGPTSFLSRAWQAWQLYFAMSCVPSGSLRPALAAVVRATAAIAAQISPIVLIGSNSFKRICEQHHPSGTQRSLQVSCWRCGLLQECRSERRILCALEQPACKHRAATALMVGVGSVAHE